MFKPCQHLLLTGFMGTGKSTLAPRLGHKLGLPAFDLDREIEAEMGLSISEIFVRKGEMEFRAAEGQILKRLLAQGPSVIATGGGTLISEAHRSLLGSDDRVIALKAPFDQLYRRIAMDENRPLCPSRGAAERLFQGRKSIYDAFLWQVSTAEPSPEALCDAIVASLSASTAGVGKKQLPVVERFISPVAGYPLVIAAHSLAQLGVLLGLRGIAPGPVAIVTDPHLEGLYASILERSLRAAGYRPHWIIVPRGEGAKSLAHLEALFQELAAIGLERGRPILTFGGGSVGDLGALAAALWKRGVPVVQIPTTLLSMVDSSIGGKSAVDLPQGKNLIGAFKQPEMVVMDPTLLKTLDGGERRAGLAEVLKHGMIGDPALFERLAQGGADLPIDAAFLRQSIGVKMDLVARDPFESGPRALLNLGHTFAHAFERLADYELRHGEAVAIGLLAATHLAHRSGLCDFPLIARVKGALEALQLPTRFSAPSTTILEAMANDKKMKAGRLRFVLPKAIGEVRVAENIPAERVLQALDDLNA